MSVLNQKTIKKTIKIDGVGLHNGKKVHMEIKPAQPNTGILFKRIDLKNNNLIIPGVFNVSSALYCTTITNNFGASVSTIEHLMGEGSKILDTKFKESISFSNDIDLLEESTVDICESGLNLKKGIGNQEVAVIPKKLEKKGFFERLFHFFK